MENILDLYKQLTTEEETSNPQSTQAPVNDPYMDPRHAQQEVQQQEEEEPLLPVGNAMGNTPAERKQTENTIFSNISLGKGSTINKRPRYDDPTTWSPEYTDRAFVQEVGIGLARGIGNGVIKGAGDIIEVGMSYFDDSWARGNWVSRGLQNAGEEMAEKFKAALPEELEHDKLGWEALLNPKFYSMQMTEIIPQMVGIIAAAYAGGNLLAGGLDAIASRTAISGATKIAAEQIVANSGRGLVGKLLTEQGLTTAGRGIAKAVGGGLTGNVLSGMVNAAELAHQYKDMEDANGNKIYTDEDLANMMSNTVSNNAKWLPIDMASFGLTFGGGWKGLGKAVKGLNPVSKGGRLFNATQQMAVSSNNFRYSIAPIFKGVGRLIGKAVPEGVEEMYQESYEEWAKKKAFAEVTGEEMPYNNDFFEFFKSKENKGTKVISAAMGGIVGGGFNIGTLINRKADENYRLWDAQKNLTEIINKQGTDAELDFQRYTIVNTLSNLVAGERGELYNEFMGSLVENENISLEEKKEFDGMFDDFQAVKEKGERLNVKGMKALLRNNAAETFATREIERVEGIAKQNIQDVQENDAMTEKEKNNKINDIEAAYAKQMQALSLILVEAKQNQANLILGKKATPLTINQSVDEFGNPIVSGGLSTDWFNEYTKEGEENAPKRTKLTTDRLTGKAKDLYNTIFKKGKEAVDKFKKSDVGKKAEELVEKGKEVVKGKSKVEEQKAAEEATTAEATPEFQEEISEEEYADFVDNGNVSDERLNDIAQKVKTQTKLSDKEEAIRTNNANAVNELIKNADAISDADFKSFNESGEISNEALDAITDLVMNKQKLSPRQGEIQSAYANSIKKLIAKKRLGTENRGKRAPSDIDYLSNNDLAEINKQFDVDIKRTDEGIDIINNKLTKAGANRKLSNKEIEAILNAIDAKVQENRSVKKDGELSEEENAFVKEQSEKDATGESLEDAEKKSKTAAVKKTTINPENLKDAPSKAALDARSAFKERLEKVFGKDIPSKNIADYHIGKSFVDRIRLHKNNPDLENVSQNEIDNYLNKFTSNNIHGPSNLDKMAVVNHQLKRMFPNTNNPTQVIITRNLFESIGSQGLGSTLGGTIYIDEKAWNQDWVFMHEMSHVYYQLSQDSPENIKLVNAALSNPELVKEIKNKYDDYTLYKVNIPGDFEEMTKGQIKALFARQGFGADTHDQLIADAIKAGEIQTVPLRQQKYIIEEMFVAQLEGPLSKNFDKVFNIKNEVRRQKDTKIWWGLIRKKGDIINNDNGVEKMLRKLNDGKEFPGDMKDFLFDTFKAVTKGVTFDSFGLDARVQAKSQEYIDAVEAIEKRMLEQNVSVPDFQIRSQEDIAEDYQNDLDEDGGSFFNTDFDSRVKGASRIIRRFGVVYNKTLRAKNLRQTRDKIVNRTKIKLFQRDIFESAIYNLAIENNNGPEFIYNIENSAIEEIQQFNKYLDMVNPETKLQLLNSMHLVMSNSKHIVGFKTTLDSDGTHSIENSLSNKEKHLTDYVLDSLLKLRASKSKKWYNFHGAIDRIYNPAEETTKKDLINVLIRLAPMNFKLDKFLEQGFVTFKGQSIPWETLIAGFIQKGLIYNTNKEGKLIVNDGKHQVFVYNARPLVEALVNTNRKFTPLSSVINAEGNLEPVRIVNNHLTKEVDNMIKFMAPDEKGVRATKEEFMEQFSHLNYKNKDELGKRYVHNQFLESIYDQYQNGILPTISQYHGLRDIANGKGIVYQDSTALEQNIDGFMTFLGSSIRPSGARTNFYVGDMGAFADSPRKFMMNMKRIKYDEVFTTNADGKTQFNPDGKILNSVFAMHNQMFDDDATGNKVKFRKAFLEAISDNVQFFNDNAKEMFGLKVKQINKEASFNLSTLFHKDKSGNPTKLNVQGKKLVAEYTINSIVNGYNVKEVFAPGIKGKDIIKRFKLNSSPVISVKNDNFKIEPIFFADEILNGSISGTDSAMYILEEDAELFQNLGKGVFDMHGGFKFLNASIEKTNPNFKGQTAYLKGYTSIVGKNHPLYKLMRARKDKYLAFYEKEHGGAPSRLLNDGSPNHIVIAVPQSSDKSNFSPVKFTRDVDENGNSIPLEYTPEGAKYTEEALSQNIDEAMKHYDNLYYSKGKFVGIESYNFGPQQLMDKQSFESGTPVQMVNSIIVNASFNGKLKEAYEIQSLIVAQKMENLRAIVNEIGLATNADYKRLVDKGLNKQDMDQAQRILFEDNGSIAHPYLVEIITNQLAKTFRRAGNTLTTPGAISQQKPDSGWRTQAKGNKALKGYTENEDGSLTAAEIVLDASKIDSVRPRRAFTVTNNDGKTILNTEVKGFSKKNQEMIERIRKEDGNLKADLMSLKFATKMLAARQFDISFEEAGKFIGEERNSANVLIGYHVKGETVIASRVPGHGPSSTGIFEVIGFNEGEGNQVSVSSEFNDIIGADNDGDALFIQTKANTRQKQWANYDNWNQAFDKMTKYWLSPAMAKQVTTKMDFKENTKDAIKNIQEKFPSQKKYVMPFSPKSRMADYNNTMVSKRNIGPIFNLHKITNQLAAARVPISKTIKVGGNVIGTFADTAVGQESRNQQSAILANIILDNVKYSYADDLGMNESNIAQAVLMVNLGMTIEQMGFVLNSPAVKLWGDLNRSNDSLYHSFPKSKEDIKKEVYSTIVIANKLMKSAKSTSLEDFIVPAKEWMKTHKFKDAKLGDSPSTIQFAVNQTNMASEQKAIIHLFDYLSNMNSEIQAISTIMAGHNKIHVNPLVLEKQLDAFDEVRFGKIENKTLLINDDFKSNPDMDHYYNVAKETLTRLQRVNPVYQESTNGVLNSITDAIGENLTDKQIIKITRDILHFNTSRLLGHNNLPKDYMVNLLDESDSNEESIYFKVAKYLEGLNSEDNVIRDEDVRNTFTMQNNSILFGQALNMNLTGNNKYISANDAFVNESLNKSEREQAQMEFEELPSDLRNDLIAYDLLTRGWKGKLSLAPFFGKDTNALINYASDEAMKNKSNTPETTKINQAVLDQLEKAIVLRYSKEASNPFDKVYIQTPMKDHDAIVDAIFNKDKIFNKILKGNRLYINVIKTKPDGTKLSLLYKLDKFTDAEASQVATERSRDQKEDRVETIARSKIKLVEDTLSKNSVIDLTNIKDDTTGTPYAAFDTGQKSKSLDYLTEAGIVYEEAMKALREGAKTETPNVDAREDWYIDKFTKKEPLTKFEYDMARDYQEYMPKSRKEAMYSEYIAAKDIANQEIKDGVIRELPQKSTEELVDMYNKYGELDVYAYSGILTPVVKELSRKIMVDQMKLHKDIKPDGKDVSKMQAWMMSGSTIPSNHPASQGLARMLETEYKAFQGEKRRYIEEMNDITHALYKEKLGYDGAINIFTLKGLRNLGLKIRDAVFSNRANLYERLYGNLVIREEKLNDQGTLVTHFKFRPKQDIEKDFAQNYISKAEKDFYDFFRKTTEELEPSTIKKREQDYIPHTSMTALEVLSSRGLLGLLANSRHEDQIIYDVKMMHDGELKNFKQIEDLFKIESARGHKNDFKKILEYRKMKLKAKKLLASGLNEDGSEIIPAGTLPETALGFGAINRFAHNRSIKATEIPSMDLNKALGDYIHSSLFVHGNDKFKGMLKLQPFIDGVLAYNEENNLPNMNKHIKTVWKDYFSRNIRQTSFMGKKVDNVILGLTRLNLFYALGYQANKNTGGLYAIGNVIAGKYHNIKDLGGGAWLKGEARFWGLDQGFKGGISGVQKRARRMARIMKNINFMEINVYDQVNMEKKHGLDAVITDIALGPMIYSEKWIQQVHMLGLLTDEQLNKFDDEGNYKPGETEVSKEDIVRLEDRVKSSHGRGYQPTDQRAIQLYSWGTALLQFSRFIPTMVHDRFAKEDVNIYGKETIGTMRSVGKMLRYVYNDPTKFKEYRDSLSPEQRARLDSGIRGVGMSAVLAMLAGTSDTASEAFWDVNYYWNYGKLSGKVIPASIRSTTNLVSGLF